MSNTKRKTTLSIGGLFLASSLTLLVGGLFVSPHVAQAVKGEGTATIDGASNATVTTSATHVFTVVLTVGASGITVDAANPTFTLPTGFTAPNVSPVATAGDVVSDGQWSAIGGTTCPVTMSSSSATGQVMTVDVTTVCTVGTGGTITLTYKGTSGVAMGATAFTIMTADDAGVPTPATPLTGDSPTITVTDTVAPTTTSIAPTGTTTSGAPFTLQVYGTNFVSSSVVAWNGANRPTTFISSTELTALISSTDIATAGTFSVTVVTLPPGGGISNAQTFTVSVPPSAPLTVTVSVGNGHGGGAVASDFHLSVYINNVLNAYTVPTLIPVGSSFTVAESLPDGYSRSFGANCSGVVLNTTPLSCTITNQDNALPENTAQLCADGIDNSANSLIDLADPSCASFIPHGTLTVNVVSDPNGTKQPADFTIHVKSNNTDVAGSPAPGAASPGTVYVLPLGAYVVSENVDTLSVQSFAGDCDMNGSVTFTTASEKTCTILNTLIAPPVVVALPNTGGSSWGGSGYALSTVTFSGQAYPVSHIRVLGKQSVTGTYAVIPPTVTSMLPDGKFIITMSNLPAANYLFAVVAVDADGRESRMLPLVPSSLSTGNNVVMDNILISPTIEIAPSVLSPDQSMRIVGHAPPLSSVEVWIDHLGRTKTFSDARGSYVIVATTTGLALGLHSATVRATIHGAAVSEFSTEKIFKISALAFPLADLNFDHVVDVSDWSIFLFRWGNTDATLKSSIDFHADGEIDVSDFSIFLEAMDG